MDELLKYVTMENVTFVMAFIGSTGTIIAGIMKFINSRVRIKLTIHGYNLTDKSIYFYVTIENHSQMPVLITDISILSNHNKYHCRKTPIKVFEETFKQSNVITSHYDYFNLSMPINLQGLSGTSGYIYFEFPLTDPQNLSNSLILEVVTNRRKVIQMKLSLDEVSHLHNN